MLFHLIVYGCNKSFSLLVRLLGAFPELTQPITATNMLAKWRSVETKTLSRLELGCFMCCLPSLLLLSDSYPCIGDRPRELCRLNRVRKLQALLWIDFFELSPTQSEYFTALFKIRSKLSQHKHLWNLLLFCSFWLKLGFTCILLSLSRFKVYPPRS